MPGDISHLILVKFPICVCLGVPEQLIGDRIINTHCLPVCTEVLSLTPVTVVGVLAVEVKVLHDCKDVQYLCGYHCALLTAQHENSC
ncbi:hypothetical protein AV530_016916 [Patagioenas fasciata monilis]|uniref:Secreted protein n=1 Tax=Patagioenas fasciata monilis TaxID=372326 RepID=A0A1V4J417_PATFA|nr:hypothetical protein AV530_016916 [Patagioenas fasciata monilis]